MARATKDEEFKRKASLTASELIDFSGSVYENAKKKILVKCKKHKTSFSMLPRKIIAGQNGCPKCSGKRKSTKDFIEQSRELHGDTLDYSQTEYNGMRKKSIFICKKHNKAFQQIAQTHLQGRVGCTDCNGQEKISISKFIEKSKSIFGQNSISYDYLPSKFSSIHEKVTLECLIHSEKYSQSAWQHYRGRQGCYKCNPYAPIDLEKLLSKSRTIYPNKQYDYSKVDFTMGVKSYVSIGCPVDSHGYFSQTLDNHLSGKEGCTNCDLKNRLTSKEEFVERSKKIHGDEKYKGYESLVLSHGLQGNLVLECKKHGEFSYSIFHHLQGLEGCIKCRKRNTSKMEQKLLIKIKNATQKEVITHDRSLLDGKEIDIYIPEKNIAIEFNGLYWHSENFGKDKWYHYNKWKLCKDKGVQLITIWEDDYSKNPDLIEKMILYKLNSLPDNRVFARNTFVKTIENSTAQTFYLENHIQGHKNGLHIGLIDKKTKKIVALSTWKIYGETASLERYSTSVSVVGGFSKLLKHSLQTFLKKASVKQIKTFADHCVSNGHLYEINGFAIEKIIDPDYFYIYKGKRWHKSNFRIKRFEKDEELKWDSQKTEKELAQLNGIARIWDCGKTKFVLNIPDSYQK